MLHHEMDMSCSLNKPKNSTVLMNAAKL